jgi:hypothetical protein
MDIFADSEADELMDIVRVYDISGMKLTISTDITTGETLCGIFGEE